MKQSKAAILVLLAGALWGSMGLFVRRLNAAGLYAMDVVLARMLSALLFMGIFMLLFSARELPYPPQRPLVLSGLGHREFASFFAVLFFRHAGYEPERHGGSALHLARNHHDSERCFVP